MVGTSPTMTAGGEATGAVGALDVLLRELPAEVAAHLRDRSSGGKLDQLSDRLPALIERALMKFRYVALWFYLLQFVSGITMFVYAGTGVIVGLSIVVPSLKMVPWLFYIVTLFLTLCAAYPVFVFILRMHERFHRFYPARPLALTEEGISFDLPLGISGLVAWRDISSVHEGIRLQATRHLVIEFKHKLSIGPAGLERKLSRLVLNGYRILPSGEEFLKAAQRYHAQATGRPDPAKQRGEPRQSILRKLAWTFRRPAR